MLSVRAAGLHFLGPREQHNARCLQRPLRTRRRFPASKASEADITQILREFQEDIRRNIRWDLNEVASKMASKEDLKKLAENMASKDDLGLVRKDLEKLAENTASKGDLWLVRKDLEKLAENTASKGDLGLVIEAQVRPDVAKTKGDDYAMPYLARSIQDLVDQLPMESILSGPEELQDRCEQRRHAEERVTRYLIENKLPEKLLISLQGRLKGSYSPDPWFDPAGKLNVKNLSGTIEICQDRALQDLLRRLRAVLRIDSPERRMRELLLCGSAGLPCVLAAAMPEKYLHNHAVLPLVELEYDYKGLIQVGPVPGDMGFATVDVGEFKSGKPDYGAAMRQLELRLKALSFVVCCVSGLQPHQVRLIGRIFVRKSGLVTMGNKAALARDALRKHGFSLNIESV